jgi:hypothetical protein
MYCELFPDTHVSWSDTNEPHINQIPTIRDRDDSCPLQFGTFRDNSGLWWRWFETWCIQQFGLWQRRFGTSIKTSVKNYRLFRTVTLRVSFIQIVVNCHFFRNKAYFSSKSKIVGVPNRLVTRKFRWSYSSRPKSSLSMSRFPVTKVTNCHLYRVPNRWGPELSGYRPILSEHQHPILSEDRRIWTVTGAILDDVYKDKNPTISERKILLIVFFARLA